MPLAAGGPALTGHCRTVLLAPTLPSHPTRHLLSSHLLWARMMLPRRTSVEIDERKVRDYLLSEDHPVGRFKARFFAALGFTADDVPAFTGEIRRMAATHDVASAEETDFGWMYTVVGELRGPKGTASVKTVWIQEHGSPVVRLVTVIPRSS